MDFERNIEEQLDELEMLLRQRRQQLVEFARAERDRRKVKERLRVFKYLDKCLQARLLDQIGQSAAQLGKGRALIKFCIEILKEPEPIAYLQVRRKYLNVIHPNLAILEWSSSVWPSHCRRIPLASGGWHEQSG